MIFMKEGLTMPNLLDVLKGVKPNVDFENETMLYDDGIIDSLDVISIIAELNDAYGVVVPPDEIIPENFNSMAAIQALVEELM